MNDSSQVIPYGKHLVDETDIESVVDVLKNRFLTQGQTVPEFELALCKYTSAKYATAVNSATSGLHVACLALGVGAGDIVWTTPNSFVASANCARYCGAEVDFVDIDATSRNMCVSSLESKLVAAAKLNCLPKVIVVVHFSGLSCDMKSIDRLANKYDVAIIEDAAHALGGDYLGHKIGSCQYSDICVLSFHPVKSITTAEGGAILTNSEALNKKALLFAKHGVTRDSEQMIGAPEGPWFYQQIELGFNYRLSDLHAALGLSQLKKLDTFITQRDKLARRYQSKLATLPLALPSTDNPFQSAWHLYMIELTTHDRTMVYKALQERGIGVNVHYIPIHYHPYYQNLGFARGDFPKSERFYHSAITLPLFPSMTEQQQDRVIDALHEVLA